MEILYGPDFNIEENTVVTIGKFDGLHEGHKKIIEKLIEVAKNEKLKSVIYTFDKNPRIVLNHEKFTPLMSNEEKSKALSKFDIDYLIYENFDDAFSKMAPEEFVKNVLVNKLHTKAVIMGENSTFGKDRSGDVVTMEELGEKYVFKVYVVGLVKRNGEVISSSKIRESV